MLKTWRVMLDDLLVDRTTEIHEHLLPQDRVYLRLHAASLKVMEQLTARFGPDEHQLFMNYESAETGLMNRRELVYRQGMIDGLRLGCYVDEIRQG